MSRDGDARPTGRKASRIDSADLFRAGAVEKVKKESPSTTPLRGFAQDERM
jgi:hypothetical protein